MYYSNSSYIISAAPYITRVAPKLMPPILLLAVPVGASAPLHPFTACQVGLGRVGKPQLEICALFAVWPEFLDFDALTIAYCN